MTTSPKMPQRAPNNNPVFVSDVIGDGSDAHRLVRVGAWELTVQGDAGTEPEIPDTALAPRLGMEIKRLRELSERHEAAGNIAPRKVDLGAASNKSDGTTYSRRGRGRPGVQRFYTEADALFLVTRSETPKAVALTREMIGVYMAVRHGLLARVAPAPASPALTQADVEAMVNAGIRAGLAEFGARVAVNHGSPVLDAGRARSMALGPMLACARKIAGPGAPQREVMRERGRIDRRVRSLLRFEPRWKLYPEHRLGELLAALEHEARLAERLSVAARGEPQRVLPFRKR